jgi:alkylation response protein AidB-like acyl-CoA dehydrogenase
VLQAAGVPHPFTLDPIGHGMAAPTVLEHGAPELARELLRPLATTEHIRCQLFSEPGAGSDLAGLATSAVPDLPRRRWLDMHAPGVETRPLRQMTGQAEFNEVYLDDARIPDTHRLGAVGNGWRVAMTTLMNERSAIGGSSWVRGAGAIADAVELWARRPDRRTPVLRDRLAALWTRAEAQRLTDQRARRSAGSGPPGPKGSIAKLVSAELDQDVYAFCMELLGPEATLYGSGALRDEQRSDDYRGPVQQRFLRSRANTIEGGTSEVLRNILGERILGLPGDLRADSGQAWKDIPRG